MHGDFELVLILTYMDSGLSFSTSSEESVNEMGSLPSHISRNISRSSAITLTAIMIEKKYFQFFSSDETKYIQVIIWPRCASRSYWRWGSHIGPRALARGPIWLSTANMT